MAADSMFKKVNKLVMIKPVNPVQDPERLVLGIEWHGEERAYPIQFLGYHHQVFDTIAGKPVIVTYCTVCHTGRVYEPVIHGKTEIFRLVGMDHYNAMFEDGTTKSWWRQGTGEAITGKLKGTVLPEMACTQMSLGKWLSMHPNSFVMQPDPVFNKEYEAMSNYEWGGGKSGLTRKDSNSWQDKSWIAGIIIDKGSKAYDWNRLLTERIIHDELEGQPVVIILANDNKSLVAFFRKNKEQHFYLTGDTLKDGNDAYDLLGNSFNPAVSCIKKLTVYQEYWHSWRAFHPVTKNY
jgi:hypothetical protein